VRAISFCISSPTGYEETILKLTFHSTLNRIDPIASSRQELVGIRHLDEVLLYLVLDRSDTPDSQSLDRISWVVETIKLHPELPIFIIFLLTFFD